MKIVNAKKIMGAVAAALLVGSFVGCAAENVNSVVDATNNNVTEVKGVAVATASGIDFSAAVAANNGGAVTVVEKASGISFSASTGNGTSNYAVYPFVEAGKAYEFAIYTTYSDEKKVEKQSVKILATGGIGALTMKDVFKFEAKADDKAYTVTTAKKDGDIDYVMYPVKAFSDNVDSAAVTYKYARADAGYTYGVRNETALPSGTWKSADKTYVATIAKKPVMQDIKAGAAAVPLADITGTANDRIWWTYVGNDWYVRQVITVKAKGYSNITYTVSDKTTAVKATGEKVKVAVAFNPNNLLAASSVSSYNLNNVINGTTYKTQALDGTTVKTRYTFTGFGKKIDQYTVGTTSYYVPNAIEVNYGDKLEEPVEKPTLTYTYFKDEIDPYKTTVGNLVRFSADTTVNYTLDGFANVTDVTVKDIDPVYYGGVYYFSTSRTINFSDKNERASNY